MDLQAKSNAFAQSTEHAALSCQECRRRKIKCDRQLPTCAACMGSSMDCVYPAGPLKPGPKAGFTRRAKKRRLEPQCHSPGTMDMRLRTMHPQHETNADLGQSFASHLPGKLSSMDTSTSPTQGCASINSNEPSNRSLPSPSPEQKDFITHRRLSWLVHPNHEPTLKQSACGEQSTMEPLADQFTPLSIQASLMDQICLAFQTDEQDIHHLIALYFENMVSFLLFTPHLLTVKLQTAPPSQIIALLGAMFSFSARFRLENQFVNGVASASNQQATRPAPNDFYLIAKNSVDRELMDLKPPPSLLMLQSMVLLSFHDLIESAEGRGWRSLGLLVRIAYELRLHLVDSDVIDTSTDHPDLWSAKEERRRTWWAIWELDVFSSTVRRLPTAIDWNQNWTMLPVDDEFWLKKKPRASCYLVADPMERFKSLQNCNNQSAKAWFIVVNSLMRTAYCVSNSQEYFWNPPSFEPPRPGRQPLPQQRISAQIKNAHEVLSNSIYCFLVALPPQLKYRGQHLFSNIALASKSTKQRDSDIYSINVMAQLTTFMLNDPNALGAGSRPTEPDSSFTKQSAESLKSLEDQQPRALDKLFAKNISMAETILSVVRNSGPDHVHFVNPLLASTIWLAAAVFLAYKYLGISDEGSQEHLLAESNVDLLKTIFRQFVQWWDMSDILETKLSEMEKELACMRKIGRSTPNDRQQHSPCKEGPQGLLHTNSDSLQSSHDSYAPAAPSLIQERGSLLSTCEPSSGLFDSDFLCDVELQGFLDGLFATFRGQEI